jgi:hypothetical protein
MPGLEAHIMQQQDVDTFEKLTAQLQSLHSEMSMLSKKSPNDAVNAFKLKFVNATLVQANAFLGPKRRPFADFESFSTEELPSNSDVTFIVSQYIECAEKFRADNIFRWQGHWFWKIGDGSEPTIRTAPPKKLEG